MDIQSLQPADPLYPAALTASATAPATLRTIGNQQRLATSNETGVGSFLQSD
jgi:hypothetical protein